MFSISKKLTKETPYGIINNLFFICFTSNIYGDTKMDPLYIWNMALIPKLEPEIYPTDKTRITHIFDFPADDAIATNRDPGNNAVTLITFDKENLKVKYKTIAKNFKSYVSGGSERYLPVFSEDTIGYSQTRGFCLLNIKTKKSYSTTIFGSLDYSIGHIAVLDAEKRIFAFELFHSMRGINSIMRIVQFNDNSSKVLGDKEVERGTRLNHTKNVVFLKKGNNIQAMDINFKEADHPFARKFKQEKDRFKEVYEILIHPVLPFGVFTEYSTKKDEAWIISWRDKDNPVLQKLFYDGTAFLWFSYDGKWVAGADAINYYLMPVDPELPHFLGKPILLGKIPKYPSGGGTEAITRNPAGLVVPEWKRDSKGKEIGFLKKWDFTEAEKLIEK